MSSDKIVLDDRNNSIGQNIRWIRKSLHIRQTLVKIEGGRQHIKLSQLRGIRNELGVSYEDILDQPGEDICKRIEQLQMSLEHI